MTDLVAIDVHHRYGDRMALRGVSATLAAGEVTAIVGPNGAGKSTLLRIVAGLLEPTDGEVRLGARVVAGMDPRERARHVAIVAQRPELPFAWSVLEVVLMGRAPWTAAGALESEADRSLAQACLERVDAVDLATRDFGALSGGEQQRVLMARALAQDTAVLLLDEPTSHLDPAHALNAGRSWRALADEGRTVGVVVHDLNLAGRFADRLVLLKDGAVAAAGTPDEVLTASIVGEVYEVSARRVEADAPSLLFGEGGSDEPA